MAASGVGRGRGWLNISKGNISKPGQPPSGSLNSTYEQSDFLSSNANKQTDADAGTQQYIKLFNLVNQLSSMDDGILINQKFKVIIETWRQECPTSNQVEDSFHYLYHKCLEDEAFAMKVVAMLTTNTFFQLVISEQKIRKLFLSQIQGTYENRHTLQQSNINSFRIAVRMLGEFYNKARLSTGQHISFFIIPLISYMEMLLESAEPADIQLFTSQLFINGAAMKSDMGQQPQQLTDLLNKARKTLICNLKLTQISKLILLLAIDLSNNRFTLLPPDVLKFYQEELGDKVMANFQGSLSALSIQTQQTNKALDSYQSNVSVLQVTPPDSTSPIGESNTAVNQPRSQSQLKHQSHANNIVHRSNITTSSQHTYSNSNSVSSYNSDGKASLVNREKTGRPILGAGARLQKKQDSANGVNWKDHQREEQRNWGKDKGTSDWVERKSKSYLNKGWEHDDRFETDY